jgi:DNA-binding response OmpR family regulator
MRIIIADDDAIALEILQAALEEQGHEVIAAEDGAAALSALAGGGVQLVITDWEMPQIDGLQLCRSIRANDFGGYIYDHYADRSRRPRKHRRGADRGRG